MWHEEQRRAAAGSESTIGKTEPAYVDKFSPRRDVGVSHMRRLPIRRFSITVLFVAPVTKEAAKPSPVLPAQRNGLAGAHTFAIRNRWMAAGGALIFAKLLMPVGTFNCREGQILDRKGQ
jgi:hypothetical protein